MVSSEDHFCSRFISQKTLKRHIIYLCLFIYLSSAFTTQAQEFTHVLGHYPIKNISHEEYRAHHQNWSITQDKNGFIYAANGDGVLEFDGASWRLITAPGLKAVRTVVVDQDNVKWVGADRELGYLKPDSLGTLRYFSLKDKIPKSNPLTANIWQIFPDKDRIIFAADNALYSLKGERFSIIPHPGPGPIHREYQIHDKIYVSIAEHGMFELVGDTLQLIPGGKLFKNIRATVGLPYGLGSVLFATKGDGLYIFDGSSIKRLENEIGGYLNDNLLYAGQTLPNEIYAFATLRGGIIIMDKNGRYRGKITETEGIANNQVHGLTLDNQKTLWLAHQTGITKVDLLMPYIFFDKRNGLEGTVSSIRRHSGKLYVGTYSGLFVLDSISEFKQTKFRKIEQIKSGCFSLLETEEAIFAATANGVFRIAEEGVSQINTLLGCRALGLSNQNTDRIFVGHMHGLSTIVYADGKWQAESDIDQIKEDIFSITADKDGGLWLGTSLHTVVKIDFPVLNDSLQNLSLDQIVIDRYSDGLPEGATNVWLIDGQLLVTTGGEGGPLFKLDRNLRKFLQDKEFGQKFGLDSLVVYPRYYQNDGQYIMLETNPVAGKQYRYTAFKSGPDEYKVNRLYDEPVRSTTETHLYWDDETHLWSGGEGITNYDLSSRYDHEMSFNTFIRKVTVGQDSILFGGDPDSQVNTILGYSNLVLRFEFAAPYGFNGANKYQYWLTGFDPNWSDWSNEGRKDYTNIPEGNYKFQARAQNTYGGVSTIGTFDFEILPPWYRAWWAYLAYLLLFILFLWSLLRWRSYQLKAKNEALEKLIAVRTSEVQHQANQLRIQAEKLQELDKAKSRFFSNISHEFRTPLTLIKGPIEQLEQNFNERLNLETVKMIRRNANRLLNMVNQLLDLSKLDEGSLKLAPTEGDVYKCLRAAASSFNSHAAQRNMDYRVEIPATMLWASFDRDKLENIVYNLLGNAFKFSGDGSQISFVANYDEYGLKIQVSDAGKGIAAEKLPFVFDRFYQVDSGNTREKGGSGIGLSLSKDLVELMDGTITVSSEVGKGTFFTVQLPIQEIRTRQKKDVEDGVPMEKSSLKKPFALTKTDKRTLPNVLLVEDNADMRHFITEQLIKFYRVTTAVNGEAGLKKAITDAPDLIITDLMMPKMDGIELCKKLKTEVHTSHIPVIMLTAKAGQDNKIEGLETGADDYLTKPFDGKELLVRTKNLIEQRQKLRALYGNKELRVDPKKITVTPIDQKFLEQLLTLLEDKFSDPDFGVPQMQDDLAMSKTQLHRKLKALTNEAPGELLRNFRLKSAAQLLAQKADSVTQIAYKVGFNNLSYFAKCFKELYGVAPSSY